MPTKDFSGILIAINLKGEKSYLDIILVKNSRKIESYVSFTLSGIEHGSNGSD
jgi:hypothetical protein